MNNFNPARFFAICFLALIFPFEVQAQTAISNFGSNPGAINAYQYIPANMPAKAPLVLVLHGCTQTVASYSTETQWNDLADRQKFYVAYGEQTSANNSTECFNYFLTSDNSRGQGEALSLKQITDYMKANYSIDTTRVFVTGLSAGGAMTAVMCACYPDVFAAGAEMSGLPYGCATSEIGATYACLGQVSNTPQVWGNYARAQNPAYTGNWPRMALFQGSDDETVNIENSTEMIKQWTNLHGMNQTPGYTNSSFNGNSIIQLQQFLDSANRVQVEFYEIMNMLHGTAVYPGTCYQQGGATSALSFNEQFYSPFWAAQFFGILQLPYSITGLQNITINQQGLTYSVPLTVGSVYTWVVPTGVTIVSGQGTNTITVNWNNVNGTIYVTEMPTGGCEQGPVTLFVTVSAPAITLDAGIGNITVPAASVCSAAFASTFALTNHGNDTLSSLTVNSLIDNNTQLPYSWSGSLAPGQSTSVTLPAVNVATGAHSFTIICTLPNGGADINLSNDTARTTFIAGITPIVKLGPDTIRCGGSVTLDAFNSGDTYAWSTGAVTQTVSASQTGIYTVTVTSNGCSASGSVSVTIDTLPVINLGGGNVCAAQLTLDAGNTGDTYHWGNAATTETILVTASGNYAVTVTGANSCSASSSVTVNLSTAPAINLGTGRFCGNDFILNAGYPGYTYLWSTGATTQTITGTATGPYSVTVTGGVNCSSSATVSVSLDAVPAVNLGPGDTICGSQVALDAGNTGSLFMWSTGETTQGINATTTDTYTVTVTGADNCSASAAVSVMINRYPVVSLALVVDTVCANASNITLRGGSPAGGAYSGHQVTYGVFNVSLAGAGVYPITYAYTDTNGCMASASENMVVDVCTSIKTVDENIAINIFPNPNATGILFLELNWFAPGAKANIFDITGSLVSEQSITASVSKIDVSKLARGIYVVSIEADGIAVRRKLVIQ